MSKPPYALPEQIAERSVIAHRGKLFIALAVFVLAMAYLGFTAFQSASAYYLTVGELKAKETEFYGKNVRVNGQLVPSSFERDSVGTTIRFSLTDGQETINATHVGIVPDLFFNDHSEILLEGIYDSQGIFDTQSIIVKCPSKYQAEDESNNTPI